MERLIKWILGITTLMCSYIILSIGLGWFWTLGSSDNADKINQVLINLSYSYIAGYIFYLLVSYLPYQLKIIKLKPVIDLKINDLYNRINSCIQTFDTFDNADFVKTISLEQLTEMINKKNMYENSFYANQVGYEMNNLKFLNATKVNIFEIADSLIVYKEYMTSEQVINIEKIKDSTFFHLVKIYEESAIAKIYYSSQQFKDELIKDLFEIIAYARILKKSI
jgi:hypothetical protein